MNLSEISDIKSFLVENILTPEILRCPKYLTSKNFNTWINFIFTKISKNGRCYQLGTKIKHAKYFVNTSFIEFIGVCQNLLREKNPGNLPPRNLFLGKFLLENCPPGKLPPLLPENFPPKYAPLRETFPPENCTWEIGLLASFVVDIILRL